MADEADIAQIQNEIVEREALKYRRPINTIAPIGECHWCGEPFEADSLKLFCNGVCAGLHDRKIKGGGR
jgi:hypothetical protein